MDPQNRLQEKSDGGKTPISPGLIRAVVRQHGVDRLHDGEDEQEDGGGGGPDDVDVVVPPSSSLVVGAGGGADHHHHHMTMAMQQQAMMAADVEVDAFLMQNAGAGAGAIVPPQLIGMGYGGAASAGAMGETAALKRESLWT